MYLFNIIILNSTFFLILRTTVYPIDRTNNDFVFVYNLLYKFKQIQLINQNATTGRPTIQRRALLQSHLALQRVHQLITTTTIIFRTSINSFTEPIIRLLLRMPIRRVHVGMCQVHAASQGVRWFSRCEKFALAQGRVIHLVLPIDHQAEKTADPLVAPAHSRGRDRLPFPQGPPAKHQDRQVAPDL